MKEKLGDLQTLRLNNVNTKTFSILHHYSLKSYVRKHEYHLDVDDFRKSLENCIQVMKGKACTQAVKQNKLAMFL